MKIKLVRAKKEDIDQYKRLRLTMVKHDPLTNPYFPYKKAKTMSEKDWRKEFAFYLDNAKGILLFAKVDDECVGLFTSTFSSNPVDKHSALLSKLYVLKEYRGLGIGKKLFEAIIKETLKKKFILKMRMYVTETQETAIKMYKKHGWQETGRHVKEIFYKDKYYDDLIMEKRVFDSRG